MNLTEICSLIVKLKKKIKIKQISILVRNKT